jgi:fucose 4-O-acetylase-like acetyltransferase
VSKTVHNKHIKILDVAKGLSIILMTLVHYPFTQTYVYPNLTFLVNHVLMLFVVPIFIFISGYLMGDGSSFKAFFFAKIDGLIKPLVGFLLSITILNIIKYSMTADAISLHGIVSTVNALLSVVVFGDLGFVNYALWFVAALFWGLLALKGGIIIWGLKKPLKYVLLAVFVLLLGILNGTSVTAYYVAYVPVFFIFLVLGYGFKKWSDQYFNGISFFYSNIMFVFPILFGIGWFVLNKFKLRTDLDVFNFHFNYHYLLLLALLGIFSVFLLCRYLEKIPLLNTALVQCSHASFFILGFHVFILDVYKLAFDLKGYHPLTHVVLFILNIVVCYVIYRSAAQTPFIRMLFTPLKRIAFIQSERKLLTHKLMYRLIPKEVLAFKEIQSQDFSDKNTFNAT